jgi:hypothetical protein
MSRQTSPTLPEIVVKTIVTHTVTYFIMGLLALTLLDYAGFFADSSLNVMMRPTDDPWVMAGPLFQPRRGTFGPAPGSIEGMLFTIFPLWVHLRSLPEVLLQSLFLALILVYWVNHPQKKWLTWVMGIAFVILMSFPILGLLVGQPQ